MKKLSVTIVVIGLFFQHQCLASNPLNPIKTESCKDPLIGAMAGGVMGGPPDLVVGVISGAPMGHSKIKMTGESTAIYPKSNTEGLGFDRDYVRTLVMRDAS